MKKLQLEGLLIIYDSNGALCETRFLFFKIIIKSDFPFPKEFKGVKSKTFSFPLRNSIGDNHLWEIFLSVHTNISI